MGLFREPFGFSAGSIQTNHRRISGLARRDIFAGALTKFFRGLGDVENVVDNLDSEAERPAKLCDGAELFRVRIRAHRAEPDRRSQNRSGLVLVNVEKLRAACVLSFRLEIGHLSGNEFLAAGGDSELA